MRGEKKRKQKAENLMASNKVYAQALELVQQNNWKLVKQTAIHFQLICPAKNWLYNLYPTTQRICVDTKFGDAPSLTPVKGNIWTLLDVVKVAIKQENNND